MDILQLMILIVAIIIFLFGFALAVAFYAFNQHLSKQKKIIIEQGNKIQASVEKVKQINLKTARAGRKIYQVIVKGTGVYQDKVFGSEFLFLKPGKLVQNSYDVYIDPKNAESYFVDIRPLRTKLFKSSILWILTATLLFVIAVEIVALLAR